jgi:hypothetical protein
LSKLDQRSVALHGQADMLVSEIFQLNLILVQLRQNNQQKQQLFK